MVGAGSGNWGEKESLMAFTNEAKNCAISKTLQSADGVFDKPYIKK
jgi:hypothetical protein